MIFDKIENIGKYNLNLQFVLDDIMNNKFIKGEYNISKPDYYGIGLEYETKIPEHGLWEGHRKYLDIHVIIEGEELVFISDLNNMNPLNEYTEDYQLFEGKEQHRINLKPGYFLVLFPHEIHKTSINVMGKVSIRKKVFKKIIDE